MYIDMISKDVDKAFEQWTKDPLWKAYAKEGLSKQKKIYLLMCFWNVLQRRKTNL